MLLSALQSYPELALLIGGLLIGIAFGAIVQATGYCVMGAVSDWRVFGDRRRMQSVALAAAIAIAGTTLLRAYDVTNVDGTMYLTPRLDWAGAIAGGLIFGIGMVFAGGCISRNVVRAGSGDLRALVTIVVTGLAAYAAIGGVLGWVRSNFSEATLFNLSEAGVVSQGVPALLAAGLAISHSTTLAVTAAAAVIGLLMFAFLSGDMVWSPRHLAGGIGVGLSAVASWALTGSAHDEFAVNPGIIQGLSFVKPSGDALDWLQRATAIGLPGFGAAAVFGTLMGSAGASLIRRRFQLSGFANRDDLIRHLTGAVMMGVGGVMALGCSIGNGVTGISTLSAGAILASMSILIGAIAGLRILERFDD